MWKYKIGTVVQAESSSLIALGVHYGHVIGFDKNLFKETIIKVQWDDGSICSVHPSTVTTEEDF
jgi:hypothetical protein